LPLSGVLLSVYCPPEGPRHASVLWLILGLTVLPAPLLLFALRSVIIGPRRAPVDRAT
jgi:hypothetical protein